MSARRQSVTEFTTQRGLGARQASVQSELRPERRRFEEESQ
jgi:hypothetical protein